MLRIRRELRRISIRPSEYGAGEGYHGYLHAKADAEVGNAVLPGVGRGLHHPLYASGAESSGDEYAIDVLYVFFPECLGIDPADINGGLMSPSGVPEGLIHR